MSSVGELALKSLRKNRSLFITLSIIFGLQLKVFVTSLLHDGSPGTAWSNWVALGIPEIPGTLLILTVIFAVLVAGEVYAWRRAEDAREVRPDGYRPTRND